MRPNFDLIESLDNNTDNIPTCIVDWATAVARLNSSINLEIIIIVGKSRIRTYNTFCDLYCIT